MKPAMNQGEETMDETKAQFFTETVQQNRRMLYHVALSILHAEADAEAVKIRAQAEAEANEIVSKSLTENVIENKKIEKWDGVLPKVTGGSDTIIDLGDDVK